MDELVRLFEGLRVADVSDGMDAVGLRDVGLMDRAIRPVWRGARISGVALTVRYVPTNETVPTMPPQDYAEYARRWYAEKCPYPFLQVAQPGTVLVADLSGLEVGFWGSQVALAARKAGIVGVVLDGGCRDTSEIERQRCPVWTRHIARTTVIGRLEFAGMNEPIHCGGVKVCPGDIVVADDDGVIVVPRAAAAEVARWARKELDADKAARRRLYEALGMPPDETVQ
ncbi:4-hydroxy-4-methyl-2-oxoglutarate aldolase/4-carboxy-4-hydroxy-2-oxoadipate aldolase [bacterium HR17]|jgi:regulator of RNase E activity RraA|uniref:4-hydroxy-4-methyl-2-oxoglutarate aldolase/4-carboxy-4-hydroxy-2-oxoadipate aldolase n=1 Tax=Candidatus Fervidibacter japonicus TaxID=2035412 RepID=A0A2H5XEQ0_9BACT|nr:4-hydroxy-4-methyl-2-oxoglutarate aldolase/4-carboxy-4-hydroxy-2-oxoadipate aldolase [bacterium HR17]